MDFFRKVKSFVTGQPETRQDTAPSNTGEPTSSLRQTTVAYRAQPVLQSAGFGAAGGVQGLNWYTDKLKQDRDGDVADEFLQEQTKQDGQSQQHFLHKQKRHLRPPKDPIVFVEAGNVYVIPSRS